MIVLKQFTRKDFSKLISWVTSPEDMVQWSGNTFKYPLDEEQLEKYVRGQEGDNPVRFILKAVDTDTNTYIGNLTLERINSENKTAALACVLVGDTDYRNKGIGEFMVKEAVRIGFELLGLETITLNVYTFNKAAIRCYEKVGFFIEGLNPNSKQWGNEKWEAYKMKICKNN